MVFRLLLTLCMVPFLLHGAKKEVPLSPQEIASTTTENFLPISPLTGLPSFHSTDLIVRGAQNLIISRHFISPTISSLINTDFYIDYQLYMDLHCSYRGWITLPPQIVLTMYLEDKYIYVQDPCGVMLEFDLNSGKPCMSDQGMSNICGYLNPPSAKYDLRNTRVSYDGDQVYVRAPDGTIRAYYYVMGDRFYMEFRLGREILPNGKMIRYFHKMDEDIPKPCLIEGCDLSGQNVYTQITIDGDHYTTNTNQHLSYHFLEHMVEKKQKFKFSTSKFQLLSPRYLTKVTSSSQPEQSIGHKEQLLLLDRYHFKEKIFSCTYDDFYGFYRVNQLFHPEYQEPVYTFQYEPNKTTINTKNQSTSYLFNNQCLIQSIEYTPTERIEFEWDQDNRLHAVTVPGVFRRTYGYDGFGNPVTETFNDYLIERVFSEEGLHNLLQERREETVITYDYLSGTSLPTRRSINSVDEFFQYDQYNNLIKKINSHLITEYLLRNEAPNLHLPQTILEKDSLNMLLNRKELLYDHHCNIVQEDIYDSNNEFAYTIYRTYDNRDNLLSETDPLVNTTYYGYDQRNNPTSKTFGDKQWRMHYDSQDRLIEFCQNDHIYRYTYDIHDNVASMTDYLGNTTYYDHDPICYQQTRKSLEDVVTTSAYDFLGKKLSQTDPNGNITVFQYDKYNSPTKITHPGWGPDGAVETFSYYPNGTLKSHTDPDGCTTQYTYDFLDRVFTKTKSNATETFKYEGLNLVEHTDPEGNTKIFSYDAAGRKISEDFSNQTTISAYDSLGRLNKITKGDVTTTYIYDNADNLIEENNGYTTVLYTYDIYGNTTSIDRGGEIEYFEYDIYDRLVKNKEIATTYDGQRTIVTDPQKTTIVTKDAHERTITKQISDIKRIDYTYDKCGNLLTYENVINSYNLRNLLISQTINNRTTTFAYTPGSKLATKTLSDNTILYHSYNDLGFLQHLTSSDKTIDHTFVYDNLGRLTYAKDNLNNLAIARKHDPFGNLIEEVLDKFVIVKSYDNQNRLTSINGVEYFYQGPYLKAIRYQGHTHTYNSYDKQGRPQSETPPGLLSTHYQYNEHDLLTSIESPYFTEKCIYDPTDNLISQTINNTTTEYAYDDLSQLHTEIFSFTPDYDPISLTQTYDQRGNTPTREKNQLSYDALGRLTSYGDIEYKYDPLGRRLSKTVYIDTEDPDIEYYLYDGMEEIATLNETGAISECKILGLNNRTVLVETPHDIFVTMVDAHNNIRKLVDPTNGATIQSYNYNAFHELHPQYDSLTRYRFASRQTDPETGLIYFGQRYYDPSQLRWITPDPLGPIDITNLYAYNQNNPFKYFDPDGRYALVIPIYFIGALTFPILPAIGIAVLTSAAICGTAYGAVCLVNHLNNVYKPHTTYGITDSISPDTINEIGDRSSFNQLESRYKSKKQEERYKNQKSKDGQKITNPEEHFDRNKTSKDKKWGQKDGCPGPNTAQNKQIDGAIREAERLLDRRLTAADREKVHRHIGGQNFSYHESADEIYWLMLNE